MCVRACTYSCTINERSIKVISVTASNSILERPKECSRRQSVSLCLVKRARYSIRLEKNEAQRITCVLAIL